MAEIPNLTGLSPAQLAVLKAVFGSVQKILQGLELKMADGSMVSVPPDMILLTAITAVLTGAQHWDVSAKDLLGNHMATTCHTEEEAHLAVAAAFEGRRKAEAASGVAHGPETASVAKRPCPLCGGEFPGVDPAHDPDGSARVIALRAWEKRRRGNKKNGGTS